MVQVTTGEYKTEQIVQVGSYGIWLFGPTPNPIKLVYAPSILGEEYRGLDPWLRVPQGCTRDEETLEKEGTTKDTFYTYPAWNKDKERKVHLEDNKGRGEYSVLKDREVLWPYEQVTSVGAKPGGYTRDGLAEKRDFTHGTFSPAKAGTKRREEIDASRADTRRFYMCSRLRLN